MKVKNENVETRSWLGNASPTVEENGSKPKQRQLPISTAENEVHALTSAQSHYGHAYLEDTIRKMIEERHHIKELTLSKSGRHMNHGQMSFEHEIAEQLIHEAEQVGLSVAEYIRGIIYTRSNQLMQERTEKREREERHRHDDRFIKIEFFINKETREKLYQKYGQLNDRALVEAVKPDILQWLNERK